MKEYVESAKDADRLKQQAEAIAEAIGMNGVGDFGARYIEREIIHTETLDDYSVYPSGGTTDYVVVVEVSPRSAKGMSGRISAGPVTRLRENGFIIKEVAYYEDVADPPTIDTDRALPDKFTAAFIEYAGAEHPIIEYWED